jgi:hypothetical protein
MTPRRRILFGAKGLDPQAEAYYDRVIADGGIVSVPLTTLSDYFKAVKAARGQSDINNCFLSNYHAPFGLKLAAGTGATAGNRACEKLYNLIGTTNDAEQTAPANQPLALVHSGENYYFNSGVTANFISTPNAIGNQFGAEIEITAKVSLALSGTSTILNKAGLSGLDGMGYQLAVNSGGGLNFAFNPSGDVATRTTVTSSVTLTSIGYSANQIVWIKCTRVGSTGVIQFFYSFDGITYTQLGMSIASTTGNLFNTAQPVEIGVWRGPVNPLFGVIYQVTASPTIGGLPTLNFSPANYNRATSQTSWTSTTGEVWTLNTPATNNALKAAIVDQTMVMGNGTSYGLRAANLNINQTAITSYTAFRKFVNTAGAQILNELGVGVPTAEGKNLVINEVLNNERIAIRSNSGPNTARYTSTNLGLKLITGINNIANANESNPYLSNNVSQSFIAQDEAFNNTAAMNATGYNLLARNNAASLWTNAILVGDAICAGEDSVGVQTAMWDIYKSLLKIA